MPENEPIADGAQSVPVAAEAGETDNGVRQGLYDPASLHRLDDEAKAAYRDDYGKMADEIAAENAARDKAAAGPAEKGAR